MADHAMRTLTPLAIVDACWRRIGVEGDRSCALLADHIHCRNCPAYARAAIALLDNLPAEQDDGLISGIDGCDSVERIEGAAPGNGREDNNGTRLSCLVFRVGSEWLALPSLALAEVSPPCPVHSLPHRRHAAIAGLAAVRGSLLICVSLARLLDPQAPSALPFASPSPSRHPSADAPARGARVLILGQGRGAIALPVDEVAGVERIDPSALKPLPTTVSRASQHFTQAVLRSGGRNIGLLDPGLLQQAIKRSLA